MPLFSVIETERISTQPNILVISPLLRSFARAPEFVARRALRLLELLDLPPEACSRRCNSFAMAVDGTLYERLGVARDAAHADVRKAYRQASLRHHPDKGGNREDFQAIAEAYTILSDPEKRRAYDVTGDVALVEMELDLDAMSMPHRARTLDWQTPGRPATHTLAPRLGQWRRSSTRAAGSSRW